MCLVERIRKGMRFNEKESTFSFSAEQEKEDEEKNDYERIAGEILKAMNSVNQDLVFTIETEKDFENSRLPTLGQV